MATVPGVNGGDDLPLERLREQIERQRRLGRLLEALAARYGAEEEVSVAELTTTIEVMTMLEKYYDPQQLETLEQRRREAGEERIRQVEGEWPRLIAQVRAEMEQGTPPSDPRVQELARCWMGLVREFTGGAPAIAGSVARMYQQEPSVRARSGIDSEMFDYVNQAISATQPSRP